MAALVRHHPHRTGHLQPAAGRYPQRDVRRLRRRPGRDDRRRCWSASPPATCPGRRSESLSATVQRVHRDPGPAADHHHHQRGPQLGGLDHRAGDRLHLVGVGSPVAAGPDAVVAAARLRRGGPGDRASRPGASSSFEIMPNLTAIIASSFVGTVMFAVGDRDHARLRRRLRHLRVELGRDPVLGAGPAGAAAGRVVVVRPGRAVHRVARHRAVAGELRHRRVRQPAAAQQRAGARSGPRRAPGPDAGRLHPGPGASRAARSGRDELS